MRLQDWWFTTLLDSPDPLQSPLKEHIKADIVIVGAGAAGLSAALTSMGKGLKVVLIDRNICGGSSTGKSAGFLTPDSELELAQLVRRFGPEGAKELWGVATQGVDLMLSTIKTHNIECDLVKQDSLFLANDGSGLKEVREEANSRTQLGYTQTLYEKDGLEKILGSSHYQGAVRYPGTYGVNALRYAQGVKEILLQNGVQIFESTEAVSINGHKVNTHMGSVTADKIIFCCDKLSTGLTVFARNVFHAQTFLSISEPLGSQEIKVLFPDEPLQCWDSDLVYTYFRLTGNNRLLVGGGSMLTTFSVNDVTSPHIINAVIGKLKTKFPVLQKIEFLQYWPGRIDTTRDLIPTVTKDPGSPWIHFVLGCVGLPWATYCGSFAARNAIDGSDGSDDKFYHYFRADRHFLFPLWVERWLGKQMVFSLNNAWAKYYQRDTKRAQV